MTSFGSDGYVKMVMFLFLLPPLLLLPFQLFLLNETPFQRFISEVFLLLVMITKGRRLEKDSPAFDFTHTNTHTNWSNSTGHHYEHKNVYHHSLNFIFPRTFSDKNFFTLKNTDGAWWKIGHITINVFPICVAR